MLGLFRKIMSRSAAPQTAPLAPPAPVARPATLPPPLPRPVARGSVPVRVTTTVPHAAVPQPAPQASQPAQLRPTDPSPSAVAHVKIALAAIAASLPEAISHKVPAKPEQFVAIPIEKILPQLAQGQVVLTAAELRECAPDYFSALTGHDDVPVTLPLGDILTQLSPQHFTRRYQQRVEVPQEITPIFTPGGNNPGGGKPAPPQPTPTPVYRTAPTVTTTTAPAPVTAHAPSTAGKISMSSQAMASLNAAAAAPAVPRLPAATPAPAAPAPVSHTAPRSTAAPLPKKSLLSVPKPTGALAVPLSAVCKEWVQEVRAQLVDVDVEQSQILVPFEFLEPAMKSGKVLFSWEEVAAWIQPPLAIPPTRKVGEMSVDLPLKVLAPLFMAHHRGGSQQRVAVDENIPDLFAGGNSNGSTESQVVSAPRAPVAPTPSRNTVPVQPAAPTVRAPAALPKLEMMPAPSAPATPAPEEVSLEHLVGNGTGRYSVKEIVATTARLPGVTGALLAMSDGLLVTNHTPPAVKAETIAAFLPQMFGRMNQYTKELALGPLQQLTLGVESGQWHVIKCDMIYLAVLGKHGDPLPLNTLAQVAAELSSQSK